MTLTWYRSELDYDLATEAWILYDADPAAPPHIRHLIADITVDENRHRISRLLGEAFSIVSMTLSPLSACKARHRDDSLRSPTTYRLRLQIPDRYVAPIVERVHAFLVNSVLGKVFLTLLPKESARFRENAEENLASLKSLATAARSQGHSARRPLSPF